MVTTLPTFSLSLFNLVTEDGNILPPADTDEVPANQKPAEKRSADETPEENDTQHEEEPSLCAENQNHTDV